MFSFSEVIIPKEKTLNLTGFKVSLNIRHLFEETYFEEEIRFQPFIEMKDFSSLLNTYIKTNYSFLNEMSIIYGTVYSVYNECIEFAEFDFENTLWAPIEITEIY